MTAGITTHDEHRRDESELYRQGLIRAYVAREQPLGNPVGQLPLDHSFERSGPIDWGKPLGGLPARQEGIKPLIKVRRSRSSMARGRLSTSMRRRAAASSIRSTALSGRNRSVI